MRTFDGDSYDEVLDKDRLLNAHGKILELMSDANWRTLRTISDLTGSPEASVSAHLRDFRKTKWGGYVLEKRRKGNPKSGLFEYRVLPPGSPTEEPKKRRNIYKEALQLVWRHPDCSTQIKTDLTRFFERKRK